MALLNAGKPVACPEIDEAVVAAVVADRKGAFRPSDGSPADIGNMARAELAAAPLRVEDLDGGSLCYLPAAGAERHARRRMCDE